MRKRIRSFCQELWNQLKRALADKCGELPLGGIKSKSESSEMKIGKTRYLVTCKYGGKENITEKLKRLIVKKLESQSNENG